MTYVKVRGKWSSRYRAVDKPGTMIDFYLSPTRNAAAAKCFLAKALGELKDWEQPEVINTNKAPTYAAVLVPGGHPALAGQLSEQRLRGRPRQAQVADSVGARFQVDEDGLRDSHGP
jgi:transposase-like protein